MPRSVDKQRFNNEDLVLNVKSAFNRIKWNEAKYEGFIDELCEDREYQKDAIKITLRFLLGGEYQSLKVLAKENFNANETIKKRYGSWESMERHLQFPDHLSCSLDLATGVGKSFVLYGIAAILLAEGVIDRVLVLCPSTTIEDGLIDKFKMLSQKQSLRELLPNDSKALSPTIINAESTATQGSICVENYHAVLDHVNSSVRTSFKDRGARVAVLNDEAHHVANEVDGKVKRWKEFLLDEAYGFRFIVGVSGTCYVGDEYFSDVIYRYSLRQGIEERRVKRIDYVSEMPATSDPDEKWQLVINRHEELKKKLRNRGLLPLSIIITPTIRRCKEVAEEFSSYMIENRKIGAESVHDRVLVVYNNSPDVSKLPFVDRSTSKVEWILSVSMLNEGWDVKRVFQIVPHEEKAFNSKLLIAQVLGRGLRIPEQWKGSQPDVTVFNHDAWAPRIRHLVQEILEIEKRISTKVDEDSKFHFELHNIDYTLIPVANRKPMTGEYVLFSKGYIELATDSPVQDIGIEFEQAATGKTYLWNTKLERKTYTVQQIATEMFHRLQDAREDDDDDNSKSKYADLYPLEYLEKIIKESLSRIKVTLATESMKQRFLQSLGPLRRKESKNVRYTTKVNEYFTISTRGRQSDSVSASELRSSKTLFYTIKTRQTLVDEQVEFFDELTEPGSGYKTVRIANEYDFRTPLNAVVADSESERRFINSLLKPQNLNVIECWIKSTSMRFYEIDYGWKKGDHPKRGKFNIDFFIKTGNVILAVEIKGEEELKDPAEENVKKFEYALRHFDRVNEFLEKSQHPVRYKLTFLTEGNFNIFFQSLRDDNIRDFKSELDVRLATASGS